MGRHVLISGEHVLTEEKLEAREVLKTSSFGQRTAEEEHEHLHQYFVETDDWRRVFEGGVDIVYGPKGSGKSAIYSLVLKSVDTLFDRKILVIPAENPQGAAAFQSLADDPPEDEFQFVSLWKLYILTLCGQAIRDYGLKGEKCGFVLNALEEAHLLPTAFTLAKALKYTLEYVRSWATRVESVEVAGTIDPQTMIPGVSGKISLREPSSAQAKMGAISVDELLSTANLALKENGWSIWIMLDRLDVAFSNKPELEASALRALFKTYLDLKQLTNAKLKIFLRTDIWRNIVKDGFREASHLERTLTINWTSGDILNLIVRRFLSNQSVLTFYAANRDEILSDSEKQNEFFYRIMPKQVESGPNKSTTLKWLITRTSDASKEPAPRELIHMLNELRSQQLKKLERGYKGQLSDGLLFEQAVFKEALPAVSKTRLEQTLYAEYARLKGYIEKLREQRATQSTASLAKLWGVSEPEATQLATELEEAGFYEKLTAKWRAAFLYRPALGLVQGAADEDDD